jgi:O-antigen/teichoic acid export membrane protein
VGQSILLTRALGVRGYGTLALIVTFVTVVNRVTSFRMNEFVIKYVTDARALSSDADAAASIKLSMLVEATASVVAFLAVLLLAPVAGSLFLHDRAAGSLIAAYSLVVLGTIVAETSAGVLQVFNQFWLQSTLNVVGAVALLALVGAGYLSGAGVGGMVWLTVIGNVASATMLTGAAFRIVERRFGPGWWKVPLGSIRSRWRAPLAFAASTNASATLSLVTRDADPLWLSLFRGTAEVGYYRLGLAIATYALMPVSQLAQAFYPEMTRKAARREWSDFLDLIRRGSLLAAAYVLPMAIVLGLASRWLIGAVYGADFVPSAVVLVILLGGMGFSSVLFWNRPALLALGLADYPLKVNAVLAIIKVVGIFVVIRAYGYIGTAALLTGLYLVGVTLAVLKVRSEIRRRAAGQV